MHRSIYVPIATLSEKPQSRGTYRAGQRKGCGSRQHLLGEDRGKCGFPLLSIIPSAPLLLEDFPFP